ncbi:hypothetical protein C8J57DRAFT_1435480 [Mycena rebaudengoi]|nr:hypothetical protein C8J57DRAFT_1435480 [Mycena rebaudengoi]
MSYARDPKLHDIATTTLAAVSSGRVTVKGLVYDLRGKLEESTIGTAYYAPDSLLSAWNSFSPTYATPAGINTVIEILEATTLEAARSAGLKGYKRPIGVLNFASAEQPGGGFINGANAQEDHAMVYSPHVVVFRADDGSWADPMEVDVVTSPAVHAGRVRKRAAFADTRTVEEEIACAMKERMARILFLFERRQVRNLILGSFGTGVFQNDVDTVAEIWVELLCGSSARFGRSFNYVAFAVMDYPTYKTFRDAFNTARSI